MAVLRAAGLAAEAAAQDLPTRPRIGLALGGGGARGFAHIGVLLWFDEHRVPVDAVGGTSMGGLVGGFFAAGMSPVEIRQLVDSVDWALVLAPDTPFPSKTFRRKEDTRAFPSQLRFGLRGGFRLPSGLSPAEQIDLLLDRIAAPYGSRIDFNALPTPFRCVATDLRRAEVVVLGSGWLAQALRATMAIPGVFSPVALDGKVLVDGGVLNNVPADVVRQTGLADRVIAVDVSADLAAEKTSDSLFKVLDETFDVMMRSGTRLALQSADLVLAPDLKGFQGSDFSRAGDSIQRGYAEAEAHAADLLPYALSPAAYAAWASTRRARRPDATIVPARLLVEGVDAGEAARIGRRLAAHVGVPLDADALNRDLVLLTGSGRYETSTYRVDNPGRTADLVITLKKPAHGPPFLAAALDLQNTRSSTIVATVRGRLLLFDVAGRGSEGRVDIALGNTLAAAGEIHRPLGRAGLFVAPRAFALQQDEAAFKDEAYVAEYREYHAGAALDAGFSTASRFEARVGYTVDQLRRDPLIGDPDLPSVNGPQRYASARAVFDGQDRPTIPTRGLYVTADLRRFFEVPDVRTSAGTIKADPDNLLSGRLEFSVFKRAGRRGRVFVRGAGGSSFGDTAVINAFSLGGAFNLGAYYPNELRSSNFALANVGYFHELGRMAEGALGRLYFGSWIDEGSAFEHASSARFHTNVTAGFVLESPVGPVFAGASFGADGRYRVFFSLGPVLR